MKPQGGGGHTQAREGELSRQQPWDFLDDPVVGNLPSSAGAMGSTPGPETKIPHAEGQLNPCTTTSEPTGSRTHALQQVKATARRSPRAATKQEPPLATPRESKEDPAHAAKNKLKIKKRNQPCPQLDVRLPASRTGRQ